MSDPATSPTWPGQVFVVGVLVMFVLVGGLTVALGVASSAPWLVALWGLAMAPPVLVVPGLAAYAARRWQEKAAGERQLTEMIAQVGPLVGRTGVLTSAAPKDGYPLPQGRRALNFRDDGRDDLVLPVLDAEGLPAAGTRVRIDEAVPLRRGDVPYRSEGVGVRVTPLQG